MTIADGPASRPADRKRPIAPHRDRPEDSARCVASRRSIGDVQRTRAQPTAASVRRIQILTDQESVVALNAIAVLALLARASSIAAELCTFPVPFLHSA